MLPARNNRDRLQGWSLSAVQLRMETDLCAGFCEREKSPPLTKEKNISTWSLFLSSLWWSLWNGRCKLLTEQVQHFWACALSLFNLLWKRLLLWGDFCHGNNAELCSTQHRFKEEQAVSPSSGEGCFCFDTWVPAATYLLWVRFLKPGHSIHLSQSLLEAFPKVCAAGCSACSKQLASLVPENKHDKLHLICGKLAKNMGSHSETAGHVAGETLAKASNCSVNSLPLERCWVTGVTTAHTRFPGRFCDPRNSCRSAGI